MVERDSEKSERQREIATERDSNRERDGKRGSADIKKERAREKRESGETEIQRKQKRKREEDREGD